MNEIKTYVCPCCGESLAVRFGAGPEVQPWCYGCNPPDSSNEMWKKHQVYLHGLVEHHLPGYEKCTCVGCGTQLIRRAGSLEEPRCLRCRRSEIEVLWGNVASALGARMFADIDEKMMEERDAV